MMWPPSRKGPGEEEDYDIRHHGTASADRVYLLTEGLHRVHTGLETGLQTIDGGQLLLDFHVLLTPVTANHRVTDVDIVGGE